MSHTVQPSHRAPAEQVHGNSLHPKVQAVLVKGLMQEWDYKSIAALLEISERSSHNLMESGLLNVSRYPAKSLNGCTRRASGLSLLLYLLTHSDEITAEDAQPILKKVLPLLTDSILEGVIAACRSLIIKRSGVLVVVVKPASIGAPPQDGGTAARRPPGKAPALKYGDMPDLFPATHAG